MEEDLKKNRRVYGVISAIAWFALALFWSVDMSFRWIFFGVAFAFGSIYLLKRGAFDFKSADFFQQPKRSKRSNVPDEVILTTSQKGALYFGVGTLVTLVLAFVIYALFSGFETQENEEPSSETNTEIVLTNTNNADEVLEQGNNFFNNSQFDSALIYYKHALRLSPGFKEAHYNIALIYSSQSDFSKAILTLEECLKSNPNYGDGLQLMGNCYYGQKRNDEALQYYERAYASGTRNAELSHYMAYLYDLKNNTLKAIDFYKEAIQQDSTRVEVYKRLAELEPEKADWYLKRVQELDK